MAPLDRIFHEEHGSPLGRLFLAEGVQPGAGRVPLAVIFMGPEGSPTRGIAGTSDPLPDLKYKYPGAALSPGACTDLRHRLDRYFARRAWEPIPVPSEVAGTDFQRAVWRKIARIPLGRTVTYGEIAAALGSPGAARGVGQAVGGNPPPILVPCHRVVGSKGQLTGFGGGLARKEWLLAWEGVRPARLV